MKRTVLTTVFGLGCLLGLSACVVQPTPVVEPRPVVVGPPVVEAPRVVVGPRGRVWRERCGRGFHLGPRGRRCWRN